MQIMDISNNPNIYDLNWKNLILYWKKNIKLNSKVIMMRRTFLGNQKSKGKIGASKHESLIKER